MKLGLAIPTCREGLAYPPGSVTPAALGEIAAAADTFGYDEVWANQHLVTQRSLADVLASPPNYYDPIVALAYLAATLRRARLVLATVVAPAWPAILLAKQLATLDQLTGGRVTLGLGLGAYREETDAVLGPGAAGVSRASRLEELVGALRELWASTSASFVGEHTAFTDVQVWPQPRQRSLPIHLAANSAAGVARAGRIADGWIVASRSPAEVAEQVGALRSAAREAGRDPDALEVSVQLWASVGETEQVARAGAAGSQHVRRLRHLTGGTVDEVLDGFAERNLLGTPGQIADRLAEYAAVGVDHAGLVFLAPGTSEVIESARLVADEVMAAGPAGSPRDAQAGVPTSR